mgnify:CR=1 FL=1
MLALVVVAHPSTDSYCHALAARAEAGLRTAGHEVVVLDLYDLVKQVRQMAKVGHSLARRDKKWQHPCDQPIKQY